jgi:hypothetical protein
MSTSQVRPLGGLAATMGFVMWLASGMAIGLALYLKHRDAMGGEAIAYTVTSVLYGGVGGGIFTILRAATATRPSSTPLTAALIGLSAAAGVIMLSAVWELARLGGTGDHLDLFLDAALLLGGLVLGCIVGLATRGR